MIFPNQHKSTKAWERIKLNLKMRGNNAPVKEMAFVWKYLIVPFSTRVQFVKSIYRVSRKTGAVWFMLICRPSMRLGYMFSKCPFQADFHTYFVHRAKKLEFRNNYWDLLPTLKKEAKAFVTEFLGFTLGPTFLFSITSDRRN